MDSGSIVLTSISCKSVKYFTLFQKPSIYAAVSITGGKNCQQQKHNTSADHENGENPEWDQTMQFDLDLRNFQDLFLEFRIKAQGNLLLGDKLIGISRILMADLVEGQPSGVVRHVSYRVQSSDGKPNGVLSFSYKLNLADSEIRQSPLPDLQDSSIKPNYYSLPLPAHRESLYPDLVEEQPSGVVRHVSYRVQSSDGKPNGVLSFSYKLNLPDPEIRQSPLPDLQDSSIKPNYYPLPLPAHRESLYPDLMLSETTPENVFYYHNQPSPLDLANCCMSSPPSAPMDGYYHPADRAVDRDPGYLPGNFFENGECCIPPPAAFPAAAAALSFGTYPPFDPGYNHRTPQDSFGYCNSYMKKSKYEEELMSKASSNVVRTRKYIDDASGNIQNVCDYVRPSHRHIA